MLYIYTEISSKISSFFGGGSSSEEESTPAPLPDSEGTGEDQNTTESTGSHSTTEDSKEGIICILYWAKYSTYMYIRTYMYVTRIGKTNQVGARIEY